MIVLRPVLRSTARHLGVSQVRFWELMGSKRKTRLPLSVQRWCSSETSGLSSDHLCSGTVEYQYLKKYFVRRLKATYHRFHSIPDYSVVCGCHHVYFIKDDGIYRIDKRDGILEPEQVVNLEHVSRGGGKTRAENDERFQWTIQRIRLSPQEKHLAATLKSSHKEELRCVVVRLGERSIPLLPPHNILLELESVFSFEWATDDVLFYTTLEGLRSSSVFRLHLASDGSSKITSVYEETHPDVFVEVALSRDRQILTINCNSRTSSEVMLIDVTKSCSEPLVIQPRQLDLLYYVEHWKGFLIILVNTGPAQEYQVMQAPVSEPSMASWVTLFAPSPDTAIKDMDVVGDYLLLVANTPAGKLTLNVMSLSNLKETHIIQLPSWACAIETKKPGVADQQGVLEFLLSSPVHPPVPYSLDPGKGLLLSDAGNQTYLESQDKYITTRLEACSQDGTLVPVTVFHAVPVEDLGQGWALAYCHIRGGGERGLSWHRRGRVEGKPRGVEDLQACLHNLFSLGVSSPSRAALTACSAGAVPVAALCNRNPNKMRAVTLQAPFLDVLGTMEKPNLPLTLEDREEWGDPVGNLNHRHIIASYCPLHNITPQHYPSMLLTAYSGDPRVPLEGVLKYAKFIKKAIHAHFSMKPNAGCKSAPKIVLNVQPGVNHLGPEDFVQRLEEEAFRLSFLYTELGLDLPLPRRKRKR
ncbi:prolyl endopeptidase-like isoform X2 [Girardinichthys multiradiatus]|uniref:prolyl endopeptidase-like isoform X2 n=1 Tax=Girardinichthys multiradiatus TaxID=208333 RepID=UPI001FAB7BD5|nr:prolyl endopeptidase-like isoform X2 [Girardinichthys multiradiatus]